MSEALSGANGLPPLKVGEVPGRATFPKFFPSVSSVKSSLAPLACVETLNLVHAGNQFLLSAFDVVRTEERTQEQLVVEREKAAQAGTCVLMDSGNYESYWRAPHETWAQAEFHNALQIVKPDMAFGFDIQAPPDSEEVHLSAMLSQLEADKTACATAGTTLVPIVHGAPTRLGTLCRRLVQIGSVEFIAVPERCLGAGLFDRLDAVIAIRRALDETGGYVGLHLLGTGNPLSLALFSEAGADSFDGLEWCQTAVDYSTSLLHHFSHGGLFLAQGRWGGGELSYQVKVLAHNLDFYVEWMTRVRQAVGIGGVQALVQSTFSPYTFDRCRAAGLWG